MDPFHHDLIVHLFTYNILQNIEHFPALTSNFLILFIYFLFFVCVCVRERSVWGVGVCVGIYVISLIMKIAITIAHIKMLQDDITTYNLLTIESNMVNNVCNLQREWCEKGVQIIRVSEDRLSNIYNETMLTRYGISADFTYATETTYHPIKNDLYDFMENSSVILHDTGCNECTLVPMPRLGYI